MRLKKDFSVVLFDAVPGQQERLLILVCDIWSRIISPGRI